MAIIGITGHSGSGKTTFAAMLTSYGFTHIDCDKLVHTRIYTNPAVLNKFSEVFGPEFINKDKTLNRKLLSKLVFSNEQAYKKLMVTVKPFIINAINLLTKENNGKTILLDAPTLFEFGLESICDKTIAVVSSKATERICIRDSITVDDANKRLAHQKGEEFYKGKCDYLIINNGDISELEKTAKLIADKLLKGSDS